MSRVGWCTGFLCALVVTGCGSVERRDEPDGGTDTDTTAPTVTATDPAAIAAGVAEGVAITATFSEPMDPDSLTGETFRVAADDVELAGTVSYDGSVATFTPDAPLAAGTPYVATITAGARDEAGNRVAEPHAWAFTTVTTTCVKPEGGGGCHPTLAAAIAASAAGASIAVAGGDYRENLVIDKTVTLLGGFSDDFAERDPTDIESLVRPADAMQPIVRVNGDSDDTSAVAPVIDGLTFTGGRSIDHGGAFHINASDARLRHNVIVDNQGFFLGGGVYIVNGGAARLVGNRIEANVVGGQPGSGGGGVLLEATRATLVDNVIAGNSAPEDTDYGGGLAIVSGSSATLIGNRIEGNRAGGLNIAGTGGGIAIYSGEVRIVGGVIADNELGSNGSGGGLFATGSVVSIEGAVIRNNAAGAMTGNGSGIEAVDMSTVLLTSSVVAGNRNGQAGVWLGLDTGAAVVNCTIADNDVKGIRTQAGLTVANSLILNQESGVHVESEVEVPVIARSNDFFEVDQPATGFDLESSNLAVDPKVDGSYHLDESSPLLDVGAPGPFPRAGAGETVDLPDTDMDGQPRTMIGPSDARRVDIGADERTGPVE